MFAFGEPLVIPVAGADHSPAPGAPRIAILRCASGLLVHALLKIVDVPRLLNFTTPRLLDFAIPSVARNATHRYQKERTNRESQGTVELYSNPAV